MEIITIVASLIFSLTLYRWFYLRKKKKRQQNQQVYLDLKDEKYYLDAISQDYIEAMAKYKK